jgi:hypothetical protein
MEDFNLVHAVITHKVYSCNIHAKLLDRNNQQQQNTFVAHIKIAKKSSFVNTKICIAV